MSLVDIANMMGTNEGNEKPADALLNGVPSWSFYEVVDFIHSHFEISIPCIKVYYEGLVLKVEECDLPNTPARDIPMDMLEVVSTGEKNVLILSADHGDVSASRKSTWEALLKPECKAMVQVINNVLSASLPNDVFHGVGPTRAGYTDGIKGLSQMPSLTEETLNNITYKSEDGRVVKLANTDVFADTNRFDVYCYLPEIGALKSRAAADDVRYMRYVRDFMYRGTEDRRTPERDAEYLSKYWPKVTKVINELLSTDDGSKYDITIYEYLTNSYIVVTDKVRGRSVYRRLG